MTNTIRSLTLLFAFFLAVPLANSQEYAVFEFRIGKEKELHKVVIQLYPQDAPQTVQNFQKLVKKGYYKKQAIHRAIPDYLIQLGDPKSRGKDRAAVGTGGPGYTLPAEIRLKHGAGAVAMARLPDNINPAKVSNGSQFYIMLKSAPELDRYATVFGQVVEGMEFLEELSKTQTDSNDFPNERIVVRSTSLVNAAPVQAVSAE